LDTQPADIDIPHQSLIAIFLRFLQFGFLAWGGPVAQIAMIRQELVEEEKWISPQKFNRVLSLYQALPGPEAHELCVYFGMMAAGRPGALVAGLGFMLPGFLLMLVLSWLYVAFGISSPLFQSVFLGMQPAVGALIVRAVHRIGSHALHEDAWLWGIAFLGGLAQLLKINFLITLLLAGVISMLAKRNHKLPAIILINACLLGAGYIGLSQQGVQTLPEQVGASIQNVSLPVLFWSGLRSGLLTFGGAYTVIPYLQRDAVQIGAWMTQQQFLDGLALSSLLPAPLIIFSTFVGYIGGGIAGAVLMTIAIFLPAFAFTMIGHETFERLIDHAAVHTFLDGVTAGVVGLIAATALGILSDTVVGIHAWIIFSVSLIVLFKSKSKFIVAVVVLAAGLYGLIFL
jgi:chromate transporter